MANSARYWRLGNFSTRGSAYLELGALELWGAGENLGGVLTCDLPPVSGILENLSDNVVETAAKWEVCPGLVFNFDLGSAKIVIFPRFAATTLPEFVQGCTLSYSVDGVTYVNYSVYAQFIYPGFQNLTELVSGDASNTDDLFANVSVLLSFNGVHGATAVVDRSPSPKAVTVIGAIISTDQSKFGGSSLYMNGASRLIIDANPWFTFGTADFTVELFFRQASAATAFLLDLRPNPQTNGGYFTLYTLGSVVEYYAATAPRISGGTIVYNAWNHCAVCRSLGTTSLFLNGVLIGSFADTIDYLLSPVAVGASSNGVSPIVGYFDEICITKGAARYTANFTPPVAAYITPGESTAILVENQSIGFYELLETSHVLSLAPPPLGTTHKQSVEAFTLTRFEFSGVYKLVGTVKVTPATPVARKVRLYREQDGKLVDETWSDPITGAYEFTDIPELERYTVISYDHTETYKAVVADRLIPERMI